MRPCTKAVSYPNLESLCSWSKNQLATWIAAGEPCHVSTCVNLFKSLSPSQLCWMHPLKCAPAAGPKPHRLTSQMECGWLVSSEMASGASCTAPSCLDFLGYPGVINHRQGNHYSPEIIITIISHPSLPTTDSTKVAIIEIH